MPGGGIKVPEKFEESLKGKTIYAFGDSIVAGHQYSKASFATFVAELEGMEIQRFAENGSTILDGIASMGTTIYRQLEGAPDTEPDFILFNGGTNDAQYLAENEITNYGRVREDQYNGFDNTFAGAFEETIRRMREKWPHSKIIYTAVHKLNRDEKVQQALHELELISCRKWGVTVANVYEDALLDTKNNLEQRSAYSFDRLNPLGLPGTGGTGTHPNFACIEQFYVPIVQQAIRRAAGNDMVEL